MENAFKSGSLCHVIKPDKRVRNDYCERSKIDEIYIQWIWKKDKNCPSYCFGLNWRQNVKIAWFWNSLAVLLSNRISFKHTGVFGQTYITIHRWTFCLKYLSQGSIKLHKMDVIPLLTLEYVHKYLINLKVVYSKSLTLNMISSQISK